MHINRINSYALFKENNAMRLCVDNDVKTKVNVISSNKQTDHSMTRYPSLFPYPFLLSMYRTYTTYCTALAAVHIHTHSDV